VQITKDEARRVMQRAGIPPETIDGLLAELHDPVDFDRDRQALERHGVTRDSLIDLMGGSP
jgi:hypothetical protein